LYNNIYSYIWIIYVKIKWTCRVLCSNASKGNHTDMEKKEWKHFTFDCALNTIESNTHWWIFFRLFSFLQVQVIN